MKTTILGILTIVATVANIAIFDKALTNANITSLYNHGRGRLGI